jgi:uncharacterized RDD family membrane protein YckC/type II secretory pathway pseudopilin PulG
MENEINLGEQSGNTIQPQPSMLSAQPEQAAVSPVAQVKYAGFWIRYVAVFIDNIIVQVVSGVVGFAIGIIMGIGMGSFIKEHPLMPGIVGFVLGMVLSWGYFIFMTYKYQATLGKMALGLKVYSTKSENLSLRQVVLRETVGKIVSAIILYIGYIMAGFGDKKQALHDKIAGTVVVYKDPNQKRSGVVTAIVIIIVVLFFVAIIGILASIVLVSLSSARNKAQDAGNKAVLASSQVAAISYLDENKTLKGFDPNFKLLNDCSDDQIVNISPSGKDMAIFTKSCANKGKYFCIGVEGAVLEVEESYATSGAVTCDPNNILKAAVPAENVGVLSTASSTKEGYDKVLQLIKNPAETKLKTIIINNVEPTVKNKIIYVFTSATFVDYFGYDIVTKKAEGPEEEVLSRAGDEDYLKADYPSVPESILLFGYVEALEMLKKNSDYIKYSSENIELFKTPSITLLAYDEKYGWEWNVIFQGKKPVGTFVFAVNEKEAVLIQK